MEEGIGTTGGPGQVPPGCYRHGSSPATALCVSCGRPVCAQCDRQVNYRHYCPECVQTAWPQPPYPYVVVPPPPYIPPQLPEPTDERERRWWRADWGLLEVFVTLLVIFGIYNILGVILLLSTDNPLFYSYLSYALFFCPLIALSTWFIVHRHKRGREELGLRWGKPSKTLLFGGMGGVVALASSYGVFFIIYLIFYVLAGRTPVSGEAERLQELGGGYLALILVVVVVLAPIFEEIFFRGLFYPALRSRLGPKVAILLDGLIFGALHFQPLFIISLVLVGIVLTYLYEKTESLAAPMMAHALYNLAVMIITLLMGW